MAARRARRTCRPSGAGLSVWSGSRCTFLFFSFAANVALILVHPRPQRSSPLLSNSAHQEPVQLGQGGQDLARWYILTSSSSSIVILTLLLPLEGTELEPSAGEALLREFDNLHSDGGNVNGNGDSLTPPTTTLGGGLEESEEGTTQAITPTGLVSTRSSESS